MYIVADTRKVKKFLPVIIGIIIVILFLKYYNYSKVKLDDDKARITINFIIPMEQDDIKNKILITSGINGSKCEYEYSWLTKNKLRLEIREVGHSKGYKYDVKIKHLRSHFLFEKSFGRQIQFKCIPELLEVVPSKIINTRGPIKLVFNTPIEKKEIDKYIQGDFNMSINPLKEFDSKGIVSNGVEWILYPTEDLKNNSKYNLTIKKGLKSISRLNLEKDIKIGLETSSKPKLIKIQPDNNTTWISIYPKIICEYSEEITKGYIKFDGGSGNIEIKKNKLIFKPDQLLKPGTTYNMKVQVQNEMGELSEETTSTFTTMPFEQNYLWVEVELGNIQKVTVRKGLEVVREMSCSGGLLKSPTVLGTFYLKDRGEHFFSERFNEGATHWVRITEQYLFHGIPRDENWNIKTSELNKIGQRASHGCIRLKEEDAEWFYLNVPHNTMIIIHEN